MRRHGARFRCRSTLLPRRIYLHERTVACCFVDQVVSDGKSSLHPPAAGRRYRRGVEELVPPRESPSGKRWSAETLAQASARKEFLPAFSLGRRLPVRKTAFWKKRRQRE